jgi:hypothetical protein
VTLAGAALTVAGCTGLATPEATSASASSTASPPGRAAASATPAVPGPVLLPEGTAEDNLPLFAAVTAAVWASPDSASGRAYIDALAAAGFDKAAMQVTEDQSTVGNPAESLQFSVHWGDECLIGQVGPATGTPVTVVVPALAEGTCLVGRTRPIDW